MGTEEEEEKRLSVETVFVREMRVAACASVSFFSSCWLLSASVMCMCVLCEGVVCSRGIRRGVLMAADTLDSLAGCAESAISPAVCGVEEGTGGVTVSAAVGSFCSFGFDGRPRFFPVGAFGAAAAVGVGGGAEGDSALASATTFSASWMTPGSGDGDEFSASHSPKGCCCV